MRQQHKHYYCIRAFGDGWKIEYLDDFGNWIAANYPAFDRCREYRVVPDENGWLPWYGGDRPVDPDTMVEIRFYNCIARGRGKVSEYDWDSNQIIAYRILKEVDPYAELKAAAKDPTKQIRLRGAKSWVEGDIFVFDEPPEAYEIRDKPKKMKLLAWVEDNGNLTWRREGYVYGPHWGSVWKRAPAEDKEVEVEVEVVSFNSTCSNL